MEVISYTDVDAQRWDEFCDKSSSATLLHTRKFLSYHGGRFKDASLLIVNEKGDVSGLFPAAIDPQKRGRIISHPGITFGGLLYSGRKGVSYVYAMLEAIIDWYRALGLSELIYKTTPIHLQKEQSPIDQYILWRLGATLYRRDIWNVIPLTAKRSLSKGRKWAINKALKNNISVFEAIDEAGYRIFHDMLVENLEKRHGVRPVHSYQEMILISRMFPEQIKLWLAHDSEGRICAGTWTFNYEGCALHTQYIASTEYGRNIFAVDMLLEYLLKKAEKDGGRYFSFGASSENNGLVVNEGLFEFKAGFGVGVGIHDFYKLNLQK